MVQPLTGRTLQPDPIAEAQGRNQYADLAFLNSDSFSWWDRNAATVATVAGLGIVGMVGVLTAGYGIWAMLGSMAIATDVTISTAARSLNGADSMDALWGGIKDGLFINDAKRALTGLDPDTGAAIGGGERLFSAGSTALMMLPFARPLGRFAALAMSTRLGRTIGIGAAIALGGGFIGTTEEADAGLFALRQAIRAARSVAVVGESTVTLRSIAGVSRIQALRKAKSLLRLGDAGLLIRVANPVARDPQITRAFKDGLIRKI